MYFTIHPLISKQVCRATEENKITHSSKYTVYVFCYRYEIWRKEQDGLESTRFRTFIITMGKTTATFVLLLISIFASATIADDDDDWNLDPRCPGYNIEIQKQGNRKKQRELRRRPLSSIEEQHQPKRHRTIRSLQNNEADPYIDFPSFQLKLHWEAGHCWQSEWEERDYCMDCFSRECHEGAKMELLYCSYSANGDDVRDQRLQWIPLERNATIGRFRSAESREDLCLERTETRFYRMMPCDFSNPRQLLVGFSYTKPFELQAEYNVDRCLNQVHDPKPYEEIMLTECSVARRVNTNQWRVIELEGEIPEIFLTDAPTMAPTTSMPSVAATASPVRGFEPPPERDAVAPSDTTGNLSLAPVGSLAPSMNQGRAAAPDAFTPTEAPVSAPSASSIVATTLTPSSMTSVLPDTPSETPVPTSDRGSETFLERDVVAPSETGSLSLAPVESPAPSVNQGRAAELGVFNSTESPVSVPSAFITSTRAPSSRTNVLPNAEAETPVPTSDPRIGTLLPTPIPSSTTGAPIDDEAEFITTDRDDGFDYNQNVTIITGAICFPSDAWVEERSKGRILLRNLQVGDFVKSTISDDATTRAYTEVYAFGHLAKSTKDLSYLSIRTTSNSATLDISEHHMLFLSNGKAVAASRIRVGDTLLGYAAGTVVSVVRVKKTGAIAPFTESGTFVINGQFVVSSYVDVGGLPHWMLHVGVRYWMRLCGNTEHYDAEGLNLWLPKYDTVVRWLLYGKSLLWLSCVCVGILVLFRRDMKKEY